MLENYYVLMQLGLAFTATVGEWKRLLNVFKYKDIFIMGDSRFEAPEVFSEEVKQSEELDKLKNRIEERVGQRRDPDGCCRIDLTVGDGLALVTLIKISGDTRLSEMYRGLLSGMVFSTTKAFSRAMFLYQKHAGIKDMNRNCEGSVQMHTEDVLAWVGLTPEKLDGRRIKKLTESEMPAHEYRMARIKAKKEALRQNIRRPAADAV